MVIEIITAVLLADIALSLRRRLHGGTHYGVVWSWVYPLDWLYLFRKAYSKKRRGR